MSYSARHRVVVYLMDLETNPDSDGQPLRRISLTRGNISRSKSACPRRTSSSGRKPVPMRACFRLPSLRTLIGFLSQVAPSPTVPTYTRLLKVSCTTPITLCPSTSTPTATECAGYRCTKFVVPSKGSRIHRTPELPLNDVPSSPRSHHSDARRE